MTKDIDFYINPKKKPSKKVNSEPKTKKQHGNTTLLFLS